MPFKRPAPPTHESSSNTVLPTSKRFKAARGQESDALKDIKIHIVDAKLDGSTVGELYRLVESAGGELCIDVGGSEVVVTCIGMKKRLQRHLDWEVAVRPRIRMISEEFTLNIAICAKKEKAIVTPEWIRDSVSRGEALPCGDYAALEDLHDETVKNCPDGDRESSTEPEDNEAGSSRQSEPSQTQLPSPPSSPSSDAGGTAKRFSKVSSKEKSASHHPKKPVSSAGTQSTASRASTVNVPAYLLPPDPPIPTNLAKLSYKSRYACCRPSPLVCPNQGLCNELNIIRKSREVEGEDRSALSYERAISIIKAYPNRITSLAQVKDLPYIGEKITGLVEEYLNTDQISEARSILESERYKSLTAFTSIYGIGPNTARKLYARGLRTIRDLEVWYGVRPPEGEEDDEGVYEQQLERRIISVEGQSRRRGRGRNEGAEVEDDSWIKIALGLREELDIKIPRDEVEEIGRVVGRELEQVQPGCVFTIVGGYRRGKPMSNDVDIVFTHPEVDKVKGLCGRFVNRLYERGLVSHVMHLSGFHAHNALRTTHWDSLEKALTVFTLPEDSPFARDFPEGKGGEVKRRGVRRRLDLIFAMPEVYWTAVIGWTGSIMFQRDLRQWATDKKGYKFDSSGITRRRDSKQLFPKTEKDVFDLFELEWVDPTWRNADV